jgi:NAD(P) transhydrogenase subunit alpha
MNETVLAAIYVLVLASFLGTVLIQRVPPTLHTPLMSGTNMISGIVVLGGMMVMGTVDSFFLELLAFVAIATAMANVVGGYVVTDRMLGMFKGRNQGNRREEKGS